MPKLSAAALALLLIGCGAYTPMTQADLIQHGTRTYQGCTVPQAVERTARALKTLGYQVTKEDAALGSVKTAPRALLVTSESTAIERPKILIDETETKTKILKEELSWRAKINNAGGGRIELQLTPKGYQNGVELTHDNRFVFEVMGPQFRQAWAEIEDELSDCHAR